MYVLIIFFYLICGSLEARVYNPKLEPDNYFIQKSYSKTVLENFANKWANHFKLDSDVVFSVITQESSWNHKAISNKNAKGLMQLLPTTAQFKGMSNEESLHNPYTNIFYGCKYLRWLVDRYEGDYYYALVGYYAGPGRADQLLKGKIRNGSFKTEIINYANQVLDRSKQYMEVLIGQKETEKQTQKY